MSGYGLGQLGLFPRSVSGMKGLLFAPLLHGDWEHLFSNTLPLLALGWGLFYFYRKVAVFVFLIIYFIPNVLVWAFARPSYHIGASGIVYGLALFLFTGGLLRKNAGLMALSLLIALFYGSLIWGVLPVENGISWEAHLAGGVVGFICALLFKNYLPKTSKEIEEADEEEARHDHWRVDRHDTPPPEEFE
jgi:membrane associated rhomboid family serine protease